MTGNGFKYRALIIGLGKIGLGYDLYSSANSVFTHTKAYMRDGRFEIAGGIDPNPERRLEFEQLSGKPAWGSLNSYLDERKKESVQIVSICTPPQVRLGIIDRVLDKLNPQVIFLEKPVALSVEEAANIRKRCRTKDISLFVNYTRRFLAGFQEAASEVRRGKYGRLRSVTVHYCNGLFDNASHFLNLLPLFIEGRPSVSWTGKPTKSRDRDDVNIDFVLGWSGAYVCFHAIDSPKYDIGEMDLVFLGGRILFRGYGFEMEIWLPETDRRFPQHGLLAMKERKNSLIPENPITIALEGIVAHIERSVPNPSDLDSAIETLKLCNMIADHAKK